MKTVGYIRTYLQSDMAMECQRTMICTFCEKHGLCCDHIYADKGFLKNRPAKEFWKAEKLGLETDRWIHRFPEWEEMLLAVLEGNIECILVDTKLRLYSGKKQKDLLERLCNSYGVRIIEVGGELPPKEPGSQRVVIYHYAVQPEEHIRVVLSDIDKIYEYASCQFSDRKVSSLIMDMNNTNRVNYAAVREEVEDDIVVVKSFFHLERRTEAFLKVFHSWDQRAVQIYSMEEGPLVYENDLEKVNADKMSIAAYDRHRSTYEVKTQSIQLKKFEVFVKVNLPDFKLTKTFVDEIHRGKCEQLQELMRSVSLYDMILVDSLAKLCKDITGVIKIMKNIQIPIYSIKEGGIYRCIKRNYS